MYQPRIDFLCYEYFPRRICSLICDISDDAREGRDQKGGPLPQSFLAWLIEKFRRYIYPEAKVVEAGAYEKDQREKPLPSSPSRRPPPTLAPQATTQSSQWPPQPPQRPQKFVFKSE